MSDDLIFEEPPPDRRAGSPYGAWLQRLREHPGRWGKYPEPVPGNIVTRIRRGLISGVEAGEFEATARETDKAGHKGWLYARYVGSNGQVA